jgi:hypothetical protein
VNAAQAAPPARPQARQASALPVARLAAAKPRTGVAAAHDLPAAPVPTAAGTRRRLRALAACGWPLAEIAARLGTTPDVVRKMRDTPITGRGASAARVSLYARLWEAAPAVAALYDQLWDKPPPRDTPAQRSAAARTSQAAAARGWPPPLGWDDDPGPHGIDNPSGHPAPGWRRDDRARRRSADLAAEAAELARQGCSRTRAAERLGVPRATLDRAISRTRGQAR